MEQTDSNQTGGGKGITGEREGTSQRARVNDSWTQTTVGVLTVGVGGSLGREGPRGKIRTIVIE